MTSPFRHAPPGSADGATHPSPRTRCSWPGHRVPGGRRTSKQVQRFLPHTSTCILLPVGILHHWWRERECILQFGQLRESPEERGRGGGGGKETGVCGKGSTNWKDKKGPCSDLKTEQFDFLLYADCKGSQRRWWRAGVICTQDQVRVKTCFKKPSWLCFWYVHRRRASSRGVFSRLTVLYKEWGRQCFNSFLSVCRLDTLWFASSVSLIMVWP